MSSRIVSTNAGQQRLKGNRRAGLATLLICLAASLLATDPSTAFASTVSKSGATLTYTAAAGETNHLVVGLASGTFTVDDLAATITAGAGCTRVNANRATCPGAGITSISVDAGNMGDLVWVTASTAATVTGGDGNDTLIGGAGNDVLIGCTGDDTITAGPGADVLLDGFFNCAGGGNDSFDPGTGPDRVFGGDGSDSVSYSGRTAPVYVSLDGAANDGEAGEGDNASPDVENVTGGSGDDTITGSSAANTLSGGDGADNIIGEQGSGPGASGNDTLLGGPGNDALAGGNGRNLLVGGSDDDTLHGGPMQDIFDGGPGADDIEALDGVVDSVNCGSEFDTGTADLNDVVNTTCEDVFLSSYPPPGDDTLPGADFPSDTFDDTGTVTSVFDNCSVISIRHKAKLRAKAVTVRVSLPDLGGGVCWGTLRLDSVRGGSRSAGGGVRLGSASFAVRSGRTKRISVPVTRSARRQLRNRSRIAAKASVLVHEDGQTSNAASAAVTIAAAR